jgi:hypothetical protein
MKDGYVGLGLQLITIPFALLPRLSLPLSCTAGVLPADDSALVCVVGCHIVVCMSDSVTYMAYLSVTERFAQMLWRQWRCCQLSEQCCSACQALALSAIMA